MEIKVKKMSAAVLPQKATPGSAGFDLSACIDAPITLHRGEIIKIPTGIAIELPSELAAFVFGRSGLGVRHGVVPANAVGVIDSDYRGEIAVGLINHGTEDYIIRPGDRIAQLVIMPVATVTLTAADALDETRRGAGGFGSTD